jgi:hypothetical protein
MSQLLYYYKNKNFILYNFFILNSKVFNVEYSRLKLFYSGWPLKIGDFVTPKSQLLEAIWNG